MHVTKRSDIMHIEAKAFWDSIDFKQPFTITCKQTAGIVVANNDLQELHTMINVRMWSRSIQ